MFQKFRRRRFETLLATTAVGVYLLVVLGATAAFADVASACSSWPVCTRTPTLSTPTLLIAWVHRAVASVVGVLVLATAVAAWRTPDVSRRVSVALGASLVLYPLQVAIGALVAVSGAVDPFPLAHLVAGMGIFAGLTLALAWHLEPDADDASDEATGADETTGVTDPAPKPSTAVDEPTPGDAPAAASGTATSPTLRERAYAYFRLTKPRLMWLLCLVASAGMALAAGPDLSIRTVVLTLGGGVLAIGSSGTFNHVLERDVDKQMNRTSDRPVATHEIPVRNAVAFGVTLAAASLVVFAQLNLLATALGLTAIVFYSLIYTLVLKPNTVQNTVIGGAAGALPALIGWAAVTGEIGLPGLALAGIVFLWTPAHFYNLALAYKDDYERGGFPMMPVVRGEATTRKHILLWLGATLLAATVLSALTTLGWLYAATTTGLGAVFLWTVLRLHHERTEQAAFRAFHASNAYLGALLLAVVVDALAI